MPSSAEVYLERIWKLVRGIDDGSGGDTDGIEFTKMDFLGQAVSVPAGASTAITVPTGATSAILTAEGGKGYFAINNTAASANSGGFLAENLNNVVPGIRNWSTLHVFAAVGVTIHVNFYKE